MRQKSLLPALPLQLSKGHAEIDTLILERVAARASVLSFVYAIIFGIYGITSLRLLNHYLPTLTLWQNLWPRVLFNTIPFLAIGFLLCTRWITAQTKCWIWSMGWVVIFGVASWTYTMPLVCNGHSEIYFIVNGATTAVVAVSFLAVVPPLNQMTGSFIICLFTCYLPSLFAIKAKYSPEYFQSFLLDTFLLLGSILVTTYLAHKLQHKLTTATYIAEAALKNEITNREAIIKVKTHEALELQVSASVGRIASQVAHDLRSPLSALNTLTTELSGLNENKQEILGHSISRIRAIADQLMSSYKRSRLQTPSVESNPLKSEFCTTALPRLLENLQTEKLLQFKNRPNIQLSVEVPEDLPPAKVRGCREELTRILSNLIDNSIQSIKSSGEVRITASYTPQHLIIAVTDNGRGIKPEHIAFIGQQGATFERPDGSGLGIHHARSLLESWGGAIRVDSRLKEGTKVSVYLLHREAP